MFRSGSKIIFALAALFIFFFLAGKIPLWSSDEGRYGEIAREMLESRDFVLPHFNGLPYLEKPVLAPLLTAAAYAVFGVNELSTRLVPILSALLGLFLFHRFAKRIFDEKTAAFSVLILLTTIGYVLVGRFAVIDMLMTFLMSMTLFSLFLGFQEKKARYYLLAYALMGLAFLAKGLIGIVLPGLIFVTFLIWNGNLSEIKKVKLGWGILILAAVILPWCLAMTAREPEFFKEFIVKQHFSRFSTGTFGRKRPIWFFIPVLFLTAFPWTLFAPSAIARGLKQKGQSSEIKFLISWIAVIFVFFSIPKSKLPYYLLPLSMPLALLIGNFFADVSSSRQTTSNPWLDWPWKFFSGLAILGGIGLALALFMIHAEEFVLLRLPLQIAVLVLMSGGILSFVFYRKGKFEAAVLSVAAIVYCVLLLGFIGMKMLSGFESTIHEAEAIRSQVKAGDVVAIYGSPDRFSDFIFYLNRRIVIAGPDRGTLENQSRELDPVEQNLYFFGLKEFAALFNARSRRVFCLTEERKFHELLDGAKEFSVEPLSGYHILKRDHGKILISNL